MLHVRVNVPARIPALEALAEGLVRLDEWYLETALDHGIELPALYESGIVYRREPPGREWWETANDLHSIASLRSGDCEDLAAFRAAELRVFEGDEDARVKVIRTKRGTFHAIVERGDGSEEDPSRICVQLEHERAPSTRRHRR